MRTPRSHEMIRVAYFMAKFGRHGKDRNLRPPSEFDTAKWVEVYDRLFRGIPHGYTTRELFHGSVATDRRHFQKVLEGVKANSKERRRILGKWLNASRRKFWNYINQVLSGDQLQLDIPTPEEVGAFGLSEGALRTITVNAYERSSEARRRCIEAHGTNCSICGFSFSRVYGPEAKDYIHVHHVRPLSKIRDEYVVDPVEDMCPVCPNCHAVVHMGGACRSLGEVRQMLER